MRINPAIAILLPPIALLSGCVGENLGGGFSVVNNTDQELFIYGESVPVHGGTWSYVTNDCSDVDLSVLTQRGKVFAELTQQLCPGQVWTITGPGQITLDEEQ